MSGRPPSDPGRVLLWTRVACLLAAVLVGWRAVPTAAADDAAETIVRHDIAVAGRDEPARYLAYEPAAATPPERRALLIYLYGAGGSSDRYNLRREPYAALRRELLGSGWCIVVPELGPRHFMSEEARRTLDAVIDDALARYEIDPARVHLMGTSMGGGSALAYTIHRPTRVRSVCAVMPMTDFALWVQQVPRYAPQLARSYGVGYEEDRSPYNANSAVKNLDAFERVPVMLIHGTGDEIVPYGHSRRLADGLTERGYRCVLRTVEGAGHVDDVMRDHQLEAAAFFRAAME